jgi:transaldolase
MTSPASSPLASIIEAGTKLWLDSVDPDLVAANQALGATGATSNPIIISDLVKTGRFDQRLIELMNGRKLSDHDAAWTLNVDGIGGRAGVSADVGCDARG